MQFNKCCIYFPVRQGVLAILALDALYAFIFAVVSMARQKAFSAAFGSAGMLWFEVILHIAYLILSVLFIVVVIKVKRPYAGPCLVFEPS
ncbi:uncharacterized protein BYT42DRAFT_586659 [Radiomyces spectabilis]|uniref:uncharacterized protein n=1 Tax=Radiomyces spectabilis TaxID=64574 RepID=UPI0022210C76|nr:uncharacterized protein BYT42DRAFT_586659 [Radiomyces spectabilis]KAI8367543.1 hypothetical protein BYT42DRAFT_586659 [Radiomyces spectabilis]